MSSEYLKNDPSALRLCILYEFLQRKSVRDAFDFFCRKVGEDAMDFNQFESLFNRFAEGKFDDKEVSDLKMVFKEDKKAVRFCILYESLKLGLAAKMRNLFRASVQIFDPIFDSFKKMCKALGNDVIGYQEYYSYFQRFSRGEMDFEDLEDNDNNDKKTLSDMPLICIEKLGTKLDYFDRCSLRKVSRSLRDFVDKSQFRIENGYLEVQEKRTSFMPGGIFTSGIDYIQKENDCHVSRRDKTKKINNENHFDLALKDIGVLSKNPKFRFKSLSFDYFSLWRIESFPSFNPLTTQDLKSKIQVERISLGRCHMNHVISWISLFKPEILQKISFKAYTNSSLREFEPILQMDQWKKATEIDIDVCLRIPIETFFKFKSFSLGSWFLNAEDLKKIKNICFNDPNFDKCYHRYINLERVNNEILKEIFGNPIEESAFVYRYRYSAPNSDSKDFFEITLRLMDYDDSFEIPDDSHGHTLYIRRMT